MKLVFLVHQYLPHAIGGTEVYLRGLARRARDAGWGVRIVAAREAVGAGPADLATRTIEVDGIEVVEIDRDLGAPEDPVAAEYDDPRVGRIVRSHLASERPDLVHAVHPMRLTASALDACGDLGVPYLVTLSDYWPICPRHTLFTSGGRLCRGPGHPLACAPCVRDTHRGFLDHPAVDRAGPRTWLALYAGWPRLPARLRRDLRSTARRLDRVRRSILGARRIVALSPFQRDRYVENGYPADRIEVRPHGLETAGLDRAPVASDRTRFTFIGGLIREKGPHVLVEALRLVPEARLACRLFGGGAGAYLDSLREAAAADPRIELAGTFHPDDLGDVLARTDVLAVPAIWYENEPLVVKAALHLGIPILASRIGTLAGMFEDTVEGAFLPPGDPLAWSLAIARLAARPPARHRGRAVPRMDEHAAEMIELYRQVSASSRPGG